MTAIADLEVGHVIESASRAATLLLRHATGGDEHRSWPSVASSRRGRPCARR
jgi:hypothetical protein